MLQATVEPARKGTTFSVEYRTEDIDGFSLKFPRLREPTVGPCNDAKPSVCPSDRRYRRPPHTSPGHLGPYSNRRSHTNSLWRPLGAVRSLFPERISANRTWQQLTRHGDLSRLRIGRQYRWGRMPPTSIPLRFSSRWCAVIVAPELSGPSITKRAARSVVMCSRPLSDRDVASITASVCCR